MEAHLLKCESCQRSLATLGEYISLMKAEFEVAALAKPKMPTASIWSRVRDAWARPTIRTRAIVLGSLGMIAVLSWAMISMVMTRRIEPAQLSAPVALTAIRGGENLAMTQAPSGRLLDLTIDLADLLPSNDYRLEIVGAQGQRVWAAREPASNDKLLARLPKGLSAGVYWVRLYSAQGELLREFGLRLP